MESAKPKIPFEGRISAVAAASVTASAASSAVLVPSREVALLQREVVNGAHLVFQRRTLARVPREARCAPSLAVTAFQIVLD